VSTDNTLGVLDACAAPGNKTIHLAALLNQTMEKNRSKQSFRAEIPLTAVERDSTRFDSLKSRVYKAYAKGTRSQLLPACLGGAVLTIFTVHCIKADFLSLDPLASSFKNVQTKMHNNFITNYCSLNCR
jgi:hypothetical protein